MEDKTNWNKKSTQELIETWRLYYDDLMSHKRNAPIYRKMAADLTQTLNVCPPFTGHQVQIKINNLKKQFKKEKQKHGVTGASPSDWWAFDSISNIIGKEAICDQSLVSQSLDIVLEESEALNFGGEASSTIDLEVLTLDENLNNSIREEEELEPEVVQSSSLKRKNDVLEGVSKKNKNDSLVRSTKVKNIYNEYLHVAKKHYDLQQEATVRQYDLQQEATVKQDKLLEIRQQELILHQRESEALQKICEAVESASKLQEEETKAKIEYYKYIEMDEPNSYWNMIRNVTQFLKLKSYISYNDVELEDFRLPKFINGGYLNINPPLISAERTEWCKPRFSRWYEDEVPLLSEAGYKEHFRLNRETVKYLVTLLCPFMEKENTQFRDAIPVDKRVSLALHYLASAEEYRVVAVLFGVAKSTAHQIVHNFVAAVNENLLKKVINFPLTSEELLKCSQEFETILGYPQCVGAVDGCHVPVSPKKEQATSYHNYKGWYSVVLFAVVDAKYCFTYISVGSPGRNNDSHILKTSSLKPILDSKLFDNHSKQLGDTLVPLHLIGDSAFPLGTHLLKPYPEHLNLSDSQKHFNHVFCASRRVVENAFGRVKARYRKIYKRMDCSIIFASEMIKTCCILHNIAEFCRDSCPFEWIQRQNCEENLRQPQVITTVGSNGPGKVIREAVASYLYRNKE